MKRNLLIVFIIIILTMGFVFVLLQKNCKGIYSGFYSGLQPMRCPFYCKRVSRTTGIGECRQKCMSWLEFFSLLTKKDYQEGIIIVFFNEGTTYKEAKDLLSSMGLKIEGTNSYWSAMNFQPQDSTILEKFAWFGITVPVGEEDRIISRLVRYSIIRSASKKFIDKMAF